MTHTGPMKDSEGDFGPWALAEIAGEPYGCRRCRSGLGIRFQPWDSHCGGYQDYHFQCIPCGHEWWVDGIDS